MEKLHPKAVWLFFVQFLLRFFFLGFLFILIIFGLLEEIIEESKTNISTLWKVGLGVVVAFFLYAIFCYIWARLTYRFWRYELVESALKIERGVIWKKYISIPYERVQNVDIYRGLLDRLLGLSDLQIQTAGYSGVYGARGRVFGFGAEGRLPGLAPAVAEALREDLVQRVKGTKQNQGL